MPPIFDFVDDLVPAVGVTIPEIAFPSMAPTISRRYTRSAKRGPVKIISMDIASASHPS